VIQADFEERSYDAPLYNQLERRNPYIYPPAQVLGFDRGPLFAPVSPLAPDHAGQTEDKSNLHIVVAASLSSLL
jgi:hypothetical protein